MATYVFNVLKDLLANGYIHLDDATRDGSTIVSDNTHTALSGVFRVCLIQPSSSLVAAATDNGGTDAVDLTLCSNISTLNEVTAGGYTAMASGNETDTHLASITLTKQTGASGYTKWDAADVTISSVASGQTIDGLLIVWDKNTSSTNLNTKVPLVWIGLDTSISTNGGNITISWAATGIAQVG